jgi:hypothetical protein
MSFLDRTRSCTHAQIINLRYLATRQISGWHHKGRAVSHSDEPAECTTEVSWQRIMADESLVRARRFSQDADEERLALLLPLGHMCTHPVPSPDLNSCVGPTRMIYSA